MLEALIAQYGYLAILIGTFLEGETILVRGGFAAHRHLLKLPGVILAGFIGSLTSDQILFFLGRRHGPAWLARHPKWNAGIERVRPILNRHATALILGFRFLYGLRNVTPFALGLSEVSTPRFVVLNVVGAAVWAVTISLLGWSLGEAAKQLIGHLRHYEYGVGALIIVAGALFWLWHYFGARRRGAPGGPS